MPLKLHREQRRPGNNADVSHQRQTLRSERKEALLNEIMLTGLARVLFPGALNSEFTNTLEFLRPSTNKAIPTYRVVDQYGEVVNKEDGVDTEDGEALELYKNMVCCTLFHGSS